VTYIGEIKQGWRCHEQKDCIVDYHECGGGIIGKYEGVA